jgi:hypothetical protein
LCYTISFYIEQNKAKSVFSGGGSWTILSDIEQRIAGGRRLFHPR